APKNGRASAPMTRLDSTPRSPPRWQSPTQKRPLPCGSRRIGTRRSFLPRPISSSCSLPRPPPPLARCRLRSAPPCPGSRGSAPARTPPSFTIQLEPAMFVDNFRCQAACDADDYNVARLRSSSVSLDVLARAATVRDITNRGRETPVAPQPTSQRTRERYDG